MKHLYERPNLTPRNFGEFARTISPPVSARARRIGLEDFVQHVDMGGLAYESRKSTTSRLLSRTKNSLVSFVAPAVSFSTTSLAPLSKCSRLQRLDLSRDNYDFTVSQLMRAVRTLPDLRWLSLPKEQKPLLMFFDIYDSKTEFWPTNLEYLQLNSTFGQYVAAVMWDSFLQSLPSTLTSLAFTKLAVYDLFDDISEIKGQAHQIQNLYIRMGGVESLASLSAITLPFPNLTKITIPAITVWNVAGAAFTLDDRTIPAVSNPVRRCPKHLRPPLQQVEEIVLEDTPDLPFSDHILVVDVEKFRQGCPRLMRLEVPEAYLSDKDFDIHEDRVDQLNEDLANRAKDLEGGLLGIDTSSAGLFITPPSANTGPGLKRSVRVPG